MLPTTSPTSVATRRRLSWMSREDSLVLRDLMSGSIGGAMTMAAVHPLDAVRVRLQSSPHGTTPSGVVKMAFAQEGPLGLYKGLSGPVSAQGVYKAIIFSVIGKTSRALRERRPDAPRVVVDAVSGFTAGIVNSFVVCPVEMVRNRQILNVASGRTRIGPIQTARGLLLNSGGSNSSKPSPLVFYTGLQWTMIRDGPGLALWITAFNWTERTLRERGFPGWLSIVCAGAAAGASFWTWALPADSLNTWRKRGLRIADYASPERLRGGSLLKLLYRGYPIALMRGIPAATITFSVQRYASSMIEEWILYE